MSELENEAGQEQMREHTHHRRHGSRLRSVAYSVLAFFLAFVLFLLSVCMVLYFTIFSKDYILQTMKSNSYYTMVKSELQSRMEDLTDASGFDKEFAAEFVKNYDIVTAIDEYIASFYSGENTLVRTTTFKQQLYAAIESYIQEKNIKLTDDSDTNIAYFVNEATDIYVDQISITFFSRIANYIYKAKTILNIVTGSLAVMALVIIGIIYFTNQYKHRRFRYLFLGSTGAFLAVAILPTILLLSDKLKKINLSTRSLYNLFVNYFNGLFYNFYIWSGVLLAVSVVLFTLYVQHYRRATSL